MALPQTTQAPANFARRWEVVIERGQRNTDAYQAVISLNFDFPNALMELEKRREVYERRGVVFQKSLHWANTYEGLTLEGRTLSLYIRPYLRGAN